MIDTIYNFILGASFMFSLMIAWLFLRNRKDVLSQLVVLLMLVIALGFAKDAFLGGDSQLAVCVDIVAVPIYASILYELCVPSKFRYSTLLLSELPFVILPLFLVISGSSIFYYIDLGLGVALGLVMFTWTCFAIPRYHRYLKANFSYDENLNLRWLQSILWAFFILLAIWGVSCVFYNPWFDIAYMVSALIIWIFICYSIYRNKSVVNELNPITNSHSEESPSSSDRRSEIFAAIRQLLMEDRIYLNSQLKLSDIARMANTNRTYASAFFNSENTTFFDYINKLRIEYAKHLLAESDKPIDDIAAESGFNSRRNFHRLFIAYEKVSPAEFRQKRTGL